MSPLNIGILLHYYTTPGDYCAFADEPHAGSPAVRESLEWFVEAGLLSCRFGDVSWAASLGKTDRHCRETQCFLITEKGEAMVAHLCAVQVPVCKWMQPVDPVSTPSGGEK
jgi:hypothetical protein